VTSPSPAVVTQVEELTPAWLAAALGGRVDAVTAERVGTGQIGTCHRLTLSGPDVGTTLPERVLAKLPAADPGSRELLAGAYRGEVLFYTRLADTVAVRVPACHYAAMTPGSGDFTLLLEDLAPAEQGDQVAGCSVAQAHDAAVNLAGLHGPRWCDPALLEVDGLSLNGPDDAAVLAELYGPATELFVDGLGDLVSPEDRTTLRACVQVVEAWALGRSERFGLVHGDYRLDNLLFPPGGGAGVVAVDWQTLSLGLPARDLAYFVATGLAVDDRRAHERAVVASYHAALVGHGVTSYDLEQCWDDYRFAMVQGPLVSVFGCAYGTRTERGDRMFAAMVSRACAAIRDLDTLALAR
jgi:hypothetical protein